MLSNIFRFRKCWATFFFKEKIKQHFLPLNPEQHFMLKMLGNICSSWKCSSTFSRLGNYDKHFCVKRIRGLFLFLATFHINVPELFLILSMLIKNFHSIEFKAVFSSRKCSAIYSFDGNIFIVWKVLGNICYFSP